MSNRDGFGNGFWLGTLVGGIIGGVVGATIATQKANRIEDDENSGMLTGERGAKRPLKPNRMRSMDRMEVARRSLDDKISDLNNAIDAVRSSIGQTPGDVVDGLVNRAEVDSKSQPSGSE